MVITKLKATKRGNRVNVYLDHKFVFSIAQSLVIDFGLFVGGSLSKGQVEEIKTKDLVVRYYEKALNLISKRPRSKFEIQKYLKGKFYKEEGSEKYIQKIIKKLIERNYLNDLEFAKWWVENRVSFKPRGRYLLLRELKSKGIADDICKKALKVCGVSEAKEMNFALKLANKKVRLLGTLQDIKNKKKLFDFLARKGFGYEIVSKVVNKLSVGK